MVAGLCSPVVDDPILRHAFPFDGTAILDDGQIWTASRAGEAEGGQRKGTENAKTPTFSQEYREAAEKVPLAYRP